MDLSLIMDMFLAGLCQSLQHYKVNLTQANHSWNCLLIKVTNLNNVEPRNSTKVNKSVLSVDELGLLSGVIPESNIDSLMKELGEIKRKIKILKDSSYNNVLYLMKELYLKLYQNRIF